MVAVSILAKHAADVISQASRLFPFPPNLSHLKRVRKDRDADSLLVVLCEATPINTVERSGVELHRVTGDAAEHHQLEIIDHLPTPVRILVDISSHVGLQPCPNSPAGLCSFRAFWKKRICYLLRLS